MTLREGILEPALQLYWDDMDRCRKAAAYWSLLHVTVCLPDICAALESNDGRTTGDLYIRWCNEFAKRALMSGSETYSMRCIVLHQGRASSDRSEGRYKQFAFGQPAADNRTDHLRVDGDTLHIDVGNLACELRTSVRGWIAVRERDPNAIKSLNVARNLPNLVRVRIATVPVQPLIGGAPPSIQVIKTS